MQTNYTSKKCLVRYFYSKSCKVVLLNTIELNCNKMLAMIAYKNLFPLDFADLQLNQGFVYTLFIKKDEFIQEEIKNLNNLISEKNDEIEIVKNEPLKSIEELDIVFNTKKKSNNSYKEMAQEEYQSRKQALDVISNNKVQILENEKAVLEHKIILVQNKQLHDIITRENIDSIFRTTSINEIGQETNFNEIKSSESFDLLKYLIRNGYIDETYADYMTYFYENSLSLIDKTFLRSITDKKAKEYTYKLTNPELVISRLRLADFDQEEVLNFDLLKYLLQTPPLQDYLKRYIKQLKNTKNFKFIGAFLDTEIEMPNYIKYLNEEWTELFITACNEKTLTDEQIRKYSIYTIYYTDDDDIFESVNRDDCLCDYISNERDYLAVENPEIETQSLDF